MAQREDPRDLVESSIAGIPCLIKVETLNIVPPWNGSKYTCPSSHDYYGYTDIEFSVYDRKGYSAEWLEKKMIPGDVERIEAEILKHHQCQESWDV